METREGGGQKPFFEIRILHQVRVYNAQSTSIFSSGRPAVVEVCRFGCKMSEEGSRHSSDAPAGGGLGGTGGHNSSGSNQNSGGGGSGGTRNNVVVKIGMVGDAQVGQKMDIKYSYPNRLERQP